MANFPTSGKRRGYSRTEVDAFLDRAREVYEGRAGGLGSPEIRRTAFTLVKNGYDAVSVDAALDRLETAFADREERKARSELGDSAWVAERRTSAQQVLNRLARVDGSRFSRVNPFSVGYHRDEVDRFSRRLTRYFKDEVTVSVDEVRHVVFRSQHGGYAESEVDVVLDAVVDLMLAAEQP